MKLRSEAFDPIIHENGAEASEQRIQLAVSEAKAFAEEILRRHAEATEARFQLTFNQAAAYAQERFGEILSDVRDQRQHIPAFLNATATVPALSFELSALRTSQEEIAVEFNATARYVQEIREQVEDPKSMTSILLERLATADRHTDDLVAFLKSFEQTLIEKESIQEKLRQTSELTTINLEALSREVSSRHRELLEASDKAAANMVAMWDRIEAVQADTNRSTVELARLLEVLMESQTDRASLWKSAENSTRGIGDLWQRLEFVRKEIMYEMRFGADTRQTATKQARIIAEEKVASARAAGDIRINLGSGHVAMQGYLNVDFRDLPGVDIVADVADLPFEPNTVSEIASFHVLEHFPQEQLKRFLLYWRSLLKPNGTFRAVVPDGEAMLAHYSAGTYSFENFRMVLFGAQEYEGDFHFNMLTPDSLGEALRQAGFDKITFPVKGRKNDICFEFEVVGTAS